jgi:hypothetical protein
VCQDIADSLDKGDGTDAIIIEFYKAFNMVPHDRLLTKLADSGVGRRVLVWLGEFFVDIHKGNEQEGNCPTKSK